MDESDEFKRLLTLKILELDIDDILEFPNIEYFIKCGLLEIDAVREFFTNYYRDEINEELFSEEYQSIVGE